MGSGMASFGQVADVHPLQHHHPGVASEAGVQLPIAHVHGIDAPGAPGEETVGEAPGGGPGIQGHLARRGDLKMVQGPGQFFPAPADKGGRLLEGDLDLIRHQGAGLGAGQPFHRHPAGQDQGLGLGPAFGQAPSHQELVETGFRFWVFGFQFEVSGFGYVANRNNLRFIITQPLNEPYFCG